MSATFLLLIFFTFSLFPRSLQLVLVVHEGEGRTRHRRYDVKARGKARCGVDENSPSFCIVFTTPSRSRTSSEGWEIQHRIQKN